ncbi:MAG: thiamine-phosphate kinase [Solirubrobacterales bacterium]|nr:thiamine-phosphate kinase [Solirubrobacterales bacterium]
MDARKGEFELIERLVARLPGAGETVRVGSGDDAAVVEPSGRAAVTTVDVIVEGVHFTLPAYPLAAVGRKALASSLSDLAAMGALAGEAYVALVCPPELDAAALLEIGAGLAEMAERHGVSVVGGDLSRGPVLTLAVTAVGYEPRGGRLVERRGACPGDAVAVTGELGGAAAALELLGSGAHPDLEAGEAGAIRNRQLDPVPRLREGVALAEAGATAMIDLSDGLGAEAVHLADAGGVRIELELDAIPLQAGVATIAGGERAGRELAASGGEDYELLVCLPSERASEAVGTLQSSGCRLTVIGGVSSGSGASLRDSSGAELEPRGFDHLRA